MLKYHTPSFTCFTFMLLSCLVLVSCKTSHVTELAKRHGPCSEFYLYQTKEAFLAGKPTRAVQQDKDLRVIRSESGELSLIDSNGSTAYKPDSIFAYQYCGSEYRYFNQERFKIESKGKLWIYSQSHRGGRSNHEDYFFSAGAADSVHPLKFDELEKAFPDRPEFLNKVKQYQRSRFWHKLSDRDKGNHFIIADLFEEYS